MQLPKNIKTKIRKICIKNRINYIRMFGSALTHIKKAKDVDLVIQHPKKFDFHFYSKLVEALEKTFQKSVDLIVLDSNINPVLLKEIVSQSQPVWENKNGFEEYSETLIRLLPIAEDQILSVPPALRKQSIKRINRSLHVT